MDKVYTPEVIQDQPFPFPVPGMPNPFQMTQQINNQQGLYAPAQIQTQPFPSNTTADQLISNQLNSRTKKIMGSFQFTPSGAIKIGDFRKGQAGEIDLSPVGILAKNIQGNTTFFLDGDTGDATFAGELGAGSLVTGKILVGKDGSTVIDEQGIRSTSQFKTAIIQSASPQTTTNTVYTDVSGSSFIINADRDVNIFFTIFAYLKISDPGFQQNGYFVDCILYDSFLGGAAIGTLSTPGIPATYITGSPFDTETTRTNAMPCQIQAILGVAAGSHTYKLQFKANGGGTANINSFVINILILGT